MLSYSASYDLKKTVLVLTKVHVKDVISFLFTGDALIRH